MCGAVILMAVAGVLGVVFIGKVPLLVWLKDCELVGCIWVRVEKRCEVKLGDCRSLGFGARFGALVTQFG